MLTTFIKEDAQAQLEATRQNAGLVDFSYEKSIANILEMSQQK